MRNLVVVGLLTALAAHAELSVGILGGAPFTDVVKATTLNNFQYATKSTNFTIGPALRVGLPANFRVEVDALYRPYSFSTVCSGLACANFGTTSQSQWRFPVLLQYRFKTPLVQPFVEGGVTFSHLTGLTSAFSAGPVKFLKSSDAGVVAGVGADVKIPFVKLSGEFRFSRGGDYFSDIPRLNQAEFLLGIHF